MQDNKESLPEGVVIRRYDGQIPELVFIGAILSGYYSSQVLPITNKYTVTAEIFADTARAFYRSFEKELQKGKLELQKYRDMVQMFAIEYIDKKHSIKLKRFDDSVIGIYENPSVD
jgi:hypothetical protein